MHGDLVGDDGELQHARHTGADGLRAARTAGREQMVRRHHRLVKRDRHGAIGVERDEFQGGQAHLAVEDLHPSDRDGGIPNCLCRQVHRCVGLHIGVVLVQRVGRRRGGDADIGCKSFIVGGAGDVHAAAGDMHHRPRHRTGLARGKAGDAQGSLPGRAGTGCLGQCHIHSSFWFGKKPAGFKASIFAARPDGAAGLVLASGRFCIILRASAPIRNVRRQNDAVYH